MPCADPLPLGPGDAPPLVNAVKLYDTAADKIVVELETVWDSKARLLLGVSFTEGGSLYAPVEVTGIRFQGVIRVIMAPMLLGPPFVGSMSFASALAPNIDFKIKVLGGEVSAIPGLREALQVRLCCVAAGMCGALTAAAAGVRNVAAERHLHVAEPHCGTCVAMLHAAHR